MSKSNIMLQFLGALNKSKAEKLSEIGIRVDSIIKGIKSAPRPNYNIVEVSGFLEESKRSMAELMARTYEGFSKTMLPVLKSGSLPADSYEESDLVLADKGQIDELNRLRSDNERLKREFSSMQASTGRTVSAGVPHEQVLELRNQINEKDIELQQRDHKIQKLTVDFNYSQEQAQNYQYKAQQLETRANEYASRISTIQTQLDEQTRQKNYAQTQFESATKEIRSYREQIDGLQISLNRKDREITDLKDQIERVAELEDDNEKLKQGVLEAAERIKKSSSDLKDIQEQSRREINRKDEELRNLASLIDRSKEEKELLLIDSHETSKTVEYYRVQFEKTNSDLQKRVGELEAMEGQLKMLMAGAASAASSSQPTDPLKMLDNILETESQDAQLEELQRQVSVITEERNKALSDVKKLTSELSTLSSEISELTRSNKRLEADKSSLGRELDALKGEVESELQRREKTQELVNKYRSEKNEVEQRLQDLLVENEGLQARIDEVRHEYERKLKSTDDLDNRIKDLRSERERLEGQIEELTKEVKQRERENREVSQRISDRESELQEAEQKLANQQKILHEETRLKVDLKQRLEATLKDLEDTKFKLNEQMRTTTAEEQERSKLLETITEYRLREGGLQKQISQLDGKITDQISRMESLVQEMNLKDRQIEVHLARNKEINEVVTKLRLEIDDLQKYRDETEGVTTARLAELESLQRQVSKFERENKALENNIGERKKEIAEIKDQIVKITNFSQEREKTLKSDLESLQRSTTKDIEVFQSKIKREKELSEFFKRALEVYPKYTVLMILNEVRKATSKELERTIRQTSGGVKRILKELEGEGYVKLSGDEENVEMVKSFPPF